MAWPEIVVESWEHFQELANQRCPLTEMDDVNVLFRGQRDARWNNLKPSLTRLLQGSTFERALRIERTILDEFQAQATIHLPPNLLRRAPDLGAWWTVMQHYN